MKSITHKGEIGLVLSKAEATMFWSMLNSTFVANEAFEAGYNSDFHLAELTLSDFEEVEVLLWRELDRVLRQLHKEET